VYTAVSKHNTPHPAPYTSVNTSCTMQCTVATCNPVTHIPSLSQLSHKFPHTPSVHPKHYLNFTNYFLHLQ